MRRAGYEEEIREKLRAREIRPSDESWEKLNRKLEHEKRTRPPRRMKRWIGAAAAVVAGFLVLGVFFQREFVSKSPVIAAEEVQEPKDENATEEVLTGANVETEYAVQERESAQDSRTDAAVAAPGTAGPETEVMGIADSEPEVIQEEVQLKEFREVASSVPENFSVDGDVLTQKLKEVVAEANRMERASGEVSDAEIEALLLLASDEISREREQLVQRIDAESLLFEVEMELEESFRDKVFELLKEGFRKTRTAVANGNNKAGLIRLY